MFLLTNVKDFAVARSKPLKDTEISRVAETVSI